MEAGCLLSWSCLRIYSRAGWWKTSKLPPICRCWGGSLRPGEPQGAGFATFVPSPSCRWVQPGTAGKGNICLCFGGPGVPPALSPLPPPLFIAFHQHLELEQIRRWLTPSRLTELGETCAAGEGGRHGPPRTLPSGVRGAAASQRGAEDHPGVGKPWEHPRSAFPDGGRAAVSSPHCAVLGVLCPPPRGVAGRWSRFLAGFRGSFDICHQQSALSLLKSVTEVPLAWGGWGDAGLQ